VRGSWRAPGNEVGAEGAAGAARRTGGVGGVAAVSLTSAQHRRHRHKKGGLTRFPCHRNHRYPIVDFGIGDRDVSVAFPFLTLEILKFQPWIGFLFLKIQKFCRQTLDRQAARRGRQARRGSSRDPDLRNGRTCRGPGAAVDAPAQRTVVRQSRSRSSMMPPASS